MTSFVSCVEGLNTAAARSSPSGKCIAYAEALLSILARDFDDQIVRMILVFEMAGRALSLTTLLLR